MQQPAQHNPELQNATAKSEQLAVGSRVGLDVGNTVGAVDGATVGSELGS